MIEIIRNVWAPIWWFSLTIIIVSIVVFLISRSIRRTIKIEMETYGENGGERAVNKIDHFVSLLLFLSISMPIVLVIGFVMYFLAAK